MTIATIAAFAACLAITLALLKILGPWLDALRAAGWDASRFTRGSMAALAAGGAAMLAALSAMFIIAFSW